VHKLAEGQVRRERGYQEEVQVKERARALRHNGREVDQAKRQRLDRVQVLPEYMAHQHAGDRDRDDEQERQVVRGKRQVAERGHREPPPEQVGQGSTQRDVCQVHRRQRRLEQAVGRLEPGDRRGNRLGEEAEVPEHDGEHRPVEHERAEPEPLA